MDQRGFERESGDAGALARVQSAYFVTTGVWPLVSPRTFQLITGPKKDFWLVNTAGVLITVIGVTIGLAARRQRVTPEIRLLAIGSALGLTAIDVIYVARRRIAPVYLLDAIVELLMVARWLALGRSPSERQPATATRSRT
jgi:hypothetical protein